MTLTNQTATVRTARQVTVTSICHGARGGFCDMNGSNQGIAEVTPDEPSNLRAKESGSTAISDNGTDIYGQDRPTAPQKIRQTS